MLLLERDRILAELQAGKEAWQAERESIHRLKIESLQTELEMESETHTSVVHDLERKFEEELAAVRKSLQYDRDAAVTELEQQRRSDITAVKTKMERQMADREMELSDELQSLVNEVTRLRAEGNDLTLAKSKAALEYELHIAALKQKLDLTAQQHDREMSEVGCKYRREIDAVKSDREKMEAELADRHSNEVSAQQSKLNSLGRKFHGQVTNLADRVGRLRGEVANVLSRSAVDLKNDLTVIDRQMQQLARLHSSSMSQLSSRHTEEIAYYKDQVHALRQELEQTAADNEEEMSRIRQCVEESVTAQHQSVVADLTEHHMTEINQLQMEIDRLREKCNSLSSEVTHYRNELKQRDDDIESLNKKLSKSQERMDHFNSVETGDVNKMSETEAGQKARVDELLEQIETLRVDYEQAVADVDSKSQKIYALEEAAASLQKQSEDVSIQLEFKTEETAHLHDQLNKLGHEHSKVLQEIEHGSQELLKWKQLADKLKADNVALLEKTAEETRNLQARAETLQSEKDRTLKEHEKEVAKFQTEVVATRKASEEETEHVKKNMKCLEEQFTEAVSNQLLEMEQLKQQHYGEKVTLEGKISSLQEYINELKHDLAERESCRVDLHLLTEAHILLRSEAEDLRERLEQQSLKLEEETGEHAKLQMAKDATDEKLSAIESKLQETTDEKEQLETQCGVLSGQCDQQNVQIEELQSTIEHIRQQFLQRDGEKQMIDNQRRETAEEKREMAEEKQVSQLVQVLIEENDMLLSQNSDLDNKNILLEELQSTIEHIRQQFLQRDGEKQMINNQPRKTAEEKREMAEDKQVSQLIQDLIEENEMLLSQNSDLDNKNILLEELQSTIEHIRQQFLQRDGEKQMIDNQPREMAEEKQVSQLVQDLVEENEMLLSQNSDLGNKNILLENKWLLLKQEHESVLTELESMKVHLNSVQQDSKSAVEELQLVKMKVEAEKEDRRQLEATLESVKGSSNSLKSELEKSRAESEQLKRQLQELSVRSASPETTKLQLVTDQLSAAGQEKQTVTEQTNSAELHLTSTKNSVSSLQSQLMLAEEIEELVRAKVVEEIESFHGQLDDLGGKIEVLRNDKQHLEAKLRNALDENAEMAEQIRVLESSNVSLSNSLRDSQELSSDVASSGDHCQRQVSELTVSSELKTCELDAWQERNKIHSEESESLQRRSLQAKEPLSATKSMQYRKLTAEELEDKCQLQTLNPEEVEEQSQKWQVKLSESEHSTDRLSDQVQVSIEQSDEPEKEKLKYCSLANNVVDKVSQQGDLQQENEKLKAHAATSCETIEKLELHVSELSREKQSLSTQLETVLERQKVFQEQDSIAQAELRILRQQLSELSMVQDAKKERDATAVKQKVQSEWQALQHQMTFQEQNTAGDEEFQEKHEPVLEMNRQQNVIDQQDNVAEARATISERGDGANCADDVLNENKMLREKVAVLQQRCDKQQEELEVSRRKKSQQVTFASELEQSISAECDSLSAVDGVDEHSEEGKHGNLIYGCRTTQLANTEALLQEKIDLLVEAEERCANVEADRDEVASKYEGLKEKHSSMVKELQFLEAELASEQSQAVKREELLADREEELDAVKEELQCMTEKRQTGETSLDDTEAQLISQSYLLKDADERLAELETFSRQLTEDFTERLKKRDSSITSHEELIMDLRAQLTVEKERVAETDKALAEKDKFLQECRSQLEGLKEKHETLNRQRESDMAALDEKMRNQTIEMKRKCIAKVKSVQAEYEAKLCDSAAALCATELAADTRVNKLEKVMREKESEIEVLKNQMHTLETDLEMKTSEIQLKLEHGRQQLSELESCLADTDKCQKEALEAQAEQLNREHGERIDDIKRRAGIRIGQIKRELQTVKESEVGELSRVADELRARLAACGDELQDKDDKIAELTTSMSEFRRLLQLHDDEVKEKESIIDCCRSEMENFEKKLQNYVDEIGALTASLRDAELIQTGLRDQLSAAKLEQQKLEERCEMEIRTAAQDSEQELDRLKTEYEEKLCDMKAEHYAQIKQLVKEFQHQKAQKEDEFQSSYNELLGMLFSWQLSRLTKSAYFYDIYN